jgi:hypothetical protein
MNRRTLLSVFAFTFITFAASRVGPAIGDVVTRGDSLPWQLLPWALLLVIGGALFLWSRRARRQH